MCASRKKELSKENVQLSPGALSAAQVRIMSSGEIEDDSINTQIWMQIHAQPRVFKGRNSIPGSGNLDPVTKEELDSSFVNRKIEKTIFINSQKHRGYDQDIQFWQTPHFAK